MRLCYQSYCNAAYRLVNMTRCACSLSKKLNACMHSNTHVHACTLAAALSKMERSAMELLPIAEELAVRSVGRTTASLFAELLQRCLSPSEHEHMRVVSQSHSMHVCIRIYMCMHVHWLQHSVHCQLVSLFTNYCNAAYRLVHMTICV